ncbi:MAG: T9SS type A sorting domain-containing protein [Bacteroidales bacterium]|nr:T9SS type A sorting domain-containing protein [Bacteroidales bacterium]
MKKTLFSLVVLMLLIGTNVFSQKRAMVSPALQKYEATADSRLLDDGSETDNKVISPVKSSNLLVEEIIGETSYDKQSNRCVTNRIYRFSDGTMAATWTRGVNETAFDDRGTGYNYFDGNNWGAYPDARIETQKSGWPTYAPLGESGEIVVSHNAVDGLLINRRETKGTGNWTETLIQGPAGYEKVTWPRVITSGPDHNIIHLLGQIRDGYNGQDIALAYYRSTDGGEFWDITNEVFEGVGPDAYTEVGADAQVWAEPRAGVIAFACFNIWQDIFFYKSTDEGETWEKTVVWEHPYPFYNDNTVFADTLWAPDNSGAIALDSEGKVHMAFGLSFVAHFEVGTTYTYWPGLSDGIAYWNEDMPPFEAADMHDALDPYDELIEDYNLIGWSQDLDNNGQLDFVDIIAYSELGLCTMPNIVVDDQDRVFVVYAATTEGYDNGIYNYKHIWSRASVDGGMTWQPYHVDLTSALIHIYDECVYPVLTPASDDNIYMMYNKDGSPGCAVDDDHTYETNSEFFAEIDKMEIVNIQENEDFTAGTVSQNYPNPFSSVSTVEVNLTRKADIHLEVSNLQGQKVYATEPTEARPGKHFLSIDGKGLTPGIYIYSIFAGNEKVNRKMVIE